MQRLGVIPGDRVLVLLGRPIEALAVIMACWATGAVAVPLSPNEESDALIPKLKQARGRLIFIDDVTEEAALAAVARCPRIQQIVGLDIYSGSVMSWRGLIARQPTSFEPVQSLPSNPALLIWPEQSDPNFTAGTALMLAQQALIGNLPGFVMTTNWFPDHASGLMTTLLPWDEPGLLAAILPTLLRLGLVSPLINAMLCRDAPISRTSSPHPPAGASGCNRSWRSKPLLNPCAR